MTCFIQILCLLIGLLPLTALASSLAPSASITDRPVDLKWQDCLDLARTHQPQIKLIQAQLTAAEAKLQDAHKNFFPTLSFDASHTESGTISSYSSGTNSLSASVAKDFFSTDQDNATVTAAKAAYAKTKASAQITLASASYKLREAFIGMAYAQNNIKLLESIAARRKTNLDLVSLRFDAGREHKGSLLRNDAAYRQALSDVTQARRGLDVARRQLSAAMGIEIASNISVTLNSTLTAPPDQPNISTLVEGLPEAICARADLSATEANLISAQHTYGATIAGSASLSKSGSSISLDNPSWSTRLGFSLPIYLDDRNSLNQIQYQALVDEAKAALTQTLQDLAYQLQGSYVSMVNTFEGVGIQQNFVSAARLRSEIASSQYSTGLLSFDDWDVIENDLIQQEKTMLSKQRDAQMAAAAWEQRQGKRVLQ